MVSHTQLQYYSHNYALVCMTGLLGCRWHRYKQSTKGSRKRDLAWFAFVLLGFLFTTVCFYSYLLNGGDIRDMNRYMYDWSGKWLDWKTIVLALICVFFSYQVLLMFLSWCHIELGHQVYVHPVHLVFTGVILAGLVALSVVTFFFLSWCHIVLGHQVYVHPVHLVFTGVILAGLVALSVVILDLAGSQTAIIYFSLKIFGPFLQIGAVCLLTMLTWVISHQWFKITRPAWKVVWLMVFILILVGLYISPLFINSPCVITEQNLPARPRLGAHRGASYIAPENTVISFETASQYDVFAFETDVQISYDGVPFLMHDSSLRLTTNVEEVYPDLADLDASMFNMSQLQKLDAGSWFLEIDPWNSAGSLSWEQRSQYSNQSVPTFLELLYLAANTSTHIIYDLKEPPKGHPYHDKKIKVFMDTVRQSGINQSLVIWLEREDEISDLVPSSVKVLSSNPLLSLDHLMKNNFTGIHIGQTVSTWDRIKSFGEAGLFTSVWTVDPGWLYSFYWCVGADMVNTDMCHTLSKMETPLWHMTPETYRAIWLTVDLVSAVLVVIMFIIQRSRVQVNQYKPEHLSLSVNADGNPWAHKRTRRSMKEKLLMRDVQSEMFDFEPDDNLGIESGSYDATISASEGRALSQAFQTNRASYHSNITEHSAQDFPPESSRNSVVSGGYEEEGEVIQYGGLNVNVGGRGDNGYDANRNSYHSNGSTYQTEAEIT